MPRHSDDDGGEDSEVEEEDTGDNSDSEAFLSARDNTSDWYLEVCPVL